MARPLPRAVYPGCYNEVHCMLCVSHVEALRPPLRSPPSLPPVYPRHHRPDPAQQPRLLEARHPRDYPKLHALWRGAPCGRPPPKLIVQLLSPHLHHEMVVFGFEQAAATRRPELASFPPSTYAHAQALVEAPRPAIVLVALQLQAPSVPSPALARGAQHVRGYPSPLHCTHQLQYVCAPVLPKALPPCPLLESAEPHYPRFDLRPCRRRPAVWDEHRLAAGHFCRAHPYHRRAAHKVGVVRLVRPTARIRVLHAGCAMYAIDPSPAGAQCVTKACVLVQLAVFLLTHLCTVIVPNRLAARCRTGVHQPAAVLRFEHRRPQLPCTRVPLAMIE